MKALVSRLTSSPSAAVSISTISTERSLPQHQQDLNREIECEEQAFISVARHPNSNNEPPPIDILQTQIKPVDISRLVLAPCYKYNNRLFCARLCSNEEALTCSAIKQWPIPAENAIVEFMCLPSVVGPVTLVRKDSLQPYNYECDDESKWSVKHMDRMIETIKRKHSKAESNYIIGNLEKVSSQYLRSALSRTVTSGSNDSTSTAESESCQFPVTTTAEDVNQLEDDGREVVDLFQELPSALQKLTKKNRVSGSGHSVAESRSSDVIQLPLLQRNAEVLTKSTHNSVLNRRNSASGGGIGDNSDRSSGNTATVRLDNSKPSTSKKSKKPILQAGDTIRYVHKIFKDLTQTTVIVSVNRQDKRYPVKVENDDPIEIHDVVSKLCPSLSTGKDFDVEFSGPLKTFRLIESALERKSLSISKKLFIRKCASRAGRSEGVEQRCEVDTEEDSSPFPPARDLCDEKGLSHQEDMQTSVLLPSQEEREEDLEANSSCEICPNYSKLGSFEEAPGDSGGNDLVRRRRAAVETAAKSSGRKKRSPRSEAEDHRAPASKRSRNSSSSSE